MKSRTRGLKPEFFRSRSLAKVSIEAMVTFAGLWTEADDAGNGMADSELLKGALWPKRPEVQAADVEVHLLDLERTGHIVLYEIDGERYFSVVQWAKHQSSTYRRSPAQFPGPPTNEQPTLFANFREDSRTIAPYLDIDVDKDLDLDKDANASFDRFWTIYPRREAKAKALTAFKTACKTTSATDICDGAKRSVAFWAEKGTERQFVPMPATWLNQERWRDEYTANGHGLTRGQRAMRRLGLSPDGVSGIVDTTSDEQEHPGG
jgi:hypothetical protein